MFNRKAETPLTLVRISSTIYPVSVLLQFAEYIFKYHIFKPDRQQSNALSGCHTQEQTQQAGAVTVLYLFNLGPNVTMDSQEDDTFTYDEVYVTMIAYVLQAAEFGMDVIRILGDDNDVFVMLLYWVWKMQLRRSMQMERWNGLVADINATYA